MSTLQKQLMDKFYESSRSTSDYEYLFSMETFESWANNCHQMNSEEILNYLSKLLDSAVGDSNYHPQAVKNAQDIVEEYREKLSEQKDEIS